MWFSQHCQEKTWYLWIWDVKIWNNQTIQLHFFSWAHGLVVLRTMNFRFELFPELAWFRDTVFLWKMWGCPSRPSAAKLGPQVQGDDVLPFGNWLGNPTKIEVSMGKSSINGGFSSLSCLITVQLWLTAKWEDHLGSFRNCCHQRASHLCLFSPAFPALPSHELLQAASSWMSMSSCTEMVPGLKKGKEMIQQTSSYRWIIDGLTDLLIHH